MDRFWLVWSPTGERSPRYRHADRALAIVEARRLARANPGTEFFVLGATDHLVVDALKHTALVDEPVDDIPF